MAQDIAQRAMSDRLMTDVALADMRRTLEHMIRSIDERAA